MADLVITPHPLKELSIPMRGNEPVATTYADSVQAFIDPHEG